MLFGGVRRTVVSLGFKYGAGIKFPIGVQDELNHAAIGV